MSRVIFEPRPRYVVEVGTVAVEFHDSSAAPVIEWEFWRAFDARQLAVIAASRKSLDAKHVRVVDRGDS